ncbi:MAG: efflux RND transporter periplasmic adaptor subunit [Fimbriimonadaceae bacterium]
MNQRLLIFGLAAAFAVGGCVNRDAQKQGQRTQKIVSDPTRVVEVKPATTMTLFETLPITGEVTTSDDVTVAAKIPGRIVSMHVRDGDDVTAGQVIAYLDSTNQMIQIRQATSQVGAAQSQLNQAISNARIGPSRSAAAVAQALAQLRSAQAQLQKVVRGARDEERKQADAAVASAKSNMETAKKERDRQATLYREGASSQQRFDQAENAFQAAFSQYEQAIQQQAMTRNWSRPEDITAAREAVRQAEEAVKSARANKSLDVLLNDQVVTARANLEGARSGLSLARQSLEDLKIRAPLSGRVQGKPAQVGTVLGAGTPVARIIGAGGTYFEGEFPAKVMAQIRAGNAVSIKIDGIDNQSFIGTVVSISPSASSIGRLFKARVRIPFSNMVKPGMYARGDVTLNTIPNATVVPSGSIIRRGEKDVVFVAVSGKAKMVEVRPGIASKGVTQVTGIQPGDKIVVRGQSDLDEGSSIKVESGA